MVQKRKTRQKKLMQNQIASFTTFFSAEQLYRKVQKQDATIGLATVYRHLKELVEAAELHTYQCNRRAIYSQKQQQHCHFHCQKTGKTTHFTLDSLNFLTEKIPGSIVSIQIEIEGVCDDCKTK